MEKTIKPFEKILGRFNLGIVKRFPRHSTRFAKRHFKKKPLKVAEIGTFRGENAENILKNLNVEKIYLIDPWEEHEEYSKTEQGRTQENLSRAEKKARRKLKKYSGKKVFIKKYSDGAVNEIPNNLDFIYIDGDHSYKQSKRDMENYWPKVKKGGILAGHDITGKKDDYGVARTFVEFCSEKNLRPIITRTDWIIIRD